MNVVKPKTTKNISLRDGLMNRQENIQLDTMLTQGQQSVSTDYQTAQ